MVCELGITYFHSFLTKKWADFASLKIERYINAKNLCP